MLTRGNNMKNFGMGGKNCPRKILAGIERHWNRQTDSMRRAADLTPHAANGRQVSYPTTIFKSQQPAVSLDRSRAALTIELRY